jgi:hypothetical protein
MTIIELAKDVATKAHEGQFYGTGDPYIMHPAQTANLAKRLGYGDTVQAACYLHDVLEDTTLTEAELRDQFPKEVVDAVVAVTYVGKDYSQKIKQAMTHPIGHVVKFCDASCNFANGVLHGVKPGQTEFEVIPRRAGYLATLLHSLPTPKEVDDQFAMHNPANMI